ncbi:MAG: DUF2254 family protein, partial [Acidimicrobiales bacterium]
ATRRTAISETLSIARRVVSEHQGYVTSINVDRIARAVAKAEGGDRNGSTTLHLGGIEVELLVGMGSHVAYHDPLAELRCHAGALVDSHATAIVNAVAAAIRLDDERSLTRDPAFGIEQLATIGWTSVSTARSNPHPGILVCHALRDILARWSEQGGPPEDRCSSIIYDDRVPRDVIFALGSLAVVASESMQHQTLAEIMRTVSVLLPKLPPEGVDQVADMVLRSLSALGEHVLTWELERSLDMLGQALLIAECEATAGAVKRAVDILRQSVGVLKSRSTRVPTGD